MSGSLGMMKFTAMKTKLVRSLLSCFVLVLIAQLSGCSEQPPSALPQGLGVYEKASQDLAPPAAPAPKPEDLPFELGDNPNDKTAPKKTGTFLVKFETTAGDFVVEANRSWAPRGAQRFYELVKDNFYEGCRFFRVVPGFVVQFGISGSPEVHQQWNRNIPDDPVSQSNLRGYLTFATSGPATRTSQLFINYGNNTNLDTSGFSPFARVIEGMHNVDGINPQYGEQPNQTMIEERGNDYLEASFPELDYIKRVTLVSETE